MCFGMSRRSCWNRNSSNACYNVRLIWRLNIQFSVSAVQIFSARPQALVDELPLSNIGFATVCKSFGDLILANLTFSKCFKDSKLVLLFFLKQVLSPAFLRGYKKEIINIHHGLLPSFKGANPYRQVCCIRWRYSWGLFWQLCTCWVIRCCRKCWNPIWHNLSRGHVVCIRMIPCHNALGWLRGWTLNVGNSGLWSWGETNRSYEPFRYRGTWWWSHHRTNGKLPLNMDMWKIMVLLCFCRTVLKSIS